MVKGLFIDSCLASEFLVSAAVGFFQRFVLRDLKTLIAYKAHTSAVQDIPNPLVAIDGFPMIQARCKGRFVAEGSGEISA